jgi:hypothetical protein
MGYNSTVLWALCVGLVATTPLGVFSATITCRTGLRNDMLGLATTAECIVVANCINSELGLSGDNCALGCNADEGWGASALWITTRSGEPDFDTCRIATETQLKISSGAIVEGQQFGAAGTPAFLLVSRCFV